MLFELAFLGPIIVGGTAVLVMTLLGSGRMKVALLGGLAAVLTGFAISFALSQLVFHPHVTLEMMQSALQRTWYPLAMGIIIAVVLAAYALWPGKSTTRSLEHTG